MRRISFFLGAVAAGLVGCTTVTEQGTLAELDSVAPDVEEVYLEDGLERAAESYRRYLEETPETARTPEAMRRLADLQIEQAYGVMGTGEVVELSAADTAKSKPVRAAPDMAPPEAADMPAPVSAAPLQRADSGTAASVPTGPTESEQEFEQRAAQRQDLLSQAPQDDDILTGAGGEAIPVGPREAIETYRKILETYPNYERNDQVLYQMSRAYDEIGQPDEAMKVMDRLVAEYPYSKYIDEVHFRRGEYFFVRKKYLDAESAYGSIITMGSTSSYYELALYKLGWALYKQEFYEEALHQYMSMLDHRESMGYDFDEVLEESEEHRVSDTFRV
ncbi:MAG: tetratricopeptide repeat protein, partial [Gammaproteobacteria bacterium]|nr:tetratricopeptide repeat protein [Gammaproteobacteria bacterium]